MSDPEESPNTDLSNLRNEESELSVDTVFELLSDRRRRIILHLLLTTQQKLTISDLTRLAVEGEQSQDSERLLNEDADQFQTSLIHVHIPKLTDAGVIKYDENSDTVEPTNEIHQFESFLSITDEFE